MYPTRSVANLIALLGSKSVTRAWKAGAKLPKLALDQLKDALLVAQEHGLSIPTGLQVMATNMVPKAVATGQ